MNQNKNKFEDVLKRANATILEHMGKNQPKNQLFINLLK